VRAQRDPDDVRVRTEQERGLARWGLLASVSVAICSGGGTSSSSGFLLVNEVNQTCAYCRYGPVSPLEGRLPVPVEREIVYPTRGRFMICVRK
jgi:hypothetical protein